MMSGGLGCSVATPMSQARWATALATQAEISLQTGKHPAPACGAEWMQLTPVAHMSETNSKPPDRTDSCICHHCDSPANACQSFGLPQRQPVEPFSLQAMVKPLSTDSSAGPSQCLANALGIQVTAE